MDHYLVAAQTAVPNSEAQVFKKPDNIGAAHGCARGIKAFDRLAEQLSTHVTPPVVSWRVAYPFRHVRAFRLKS